LDNICPEKLNLDKKFKVKIKILALACDRDVFKIELKHVLLPRLILHLINLYNEKTIPQADIG